MEGVEGESGKVPRQISCKHSWTNGSAIKFTA